MSRSFSHAVKQCLRLLAPPVVSLWLPCPRALRWNQMTKREIPSRELPLCCGLCPLDRVLLSTRETFCVWVDSRAGAAILVDVLLHMRLPLLSGMQTAAFILKTSPPKIIQLLHAFQIQIFGTTVGQKFIIQTQRHFLFARDWTGLRSFLFERIRTDRWNQLNRLLKLSCLAT